jgi:hypothetical protein
MQFPGYWISEQDGVVTASPGTFDDTELSESSNWTEAHQNEDPEYPAGYIKPDRIVCEAGLKLLAANPELERKVEALESGEFVIRNAEDFGLFCLWMAPWVADWARLAAKPKRSAVAGNSQLDDSSFN